MDTSFTVTCGFGHITVFSVFSREKKPCFTSCFFYHYVKSWLKNNVWLLFVHFYRIFMFNLCQIKVIFVNIVVFSFIRLGVLTKRQSVCPDSVYLVCLSLIRIFAVIRDKHFCTLLSSAGRPYSFIHQLSSFSSCFSELQHTYCSLSATCVLPQHQH